MFDKHWMTIVRRVREQVTDLSDPLTCKLLGGKWVMEKKWEYIHIPSNSDTISLHQ